MFRREVVTQADQLAEEDLVALAVVLEHRGSDDAIRNGNDGSLFGPQLRGAKADVFDRSALVANAAGISDLKSLVGQHRNAAEQVFKRFLRAETDGQAANAETGERCGNVTAEPRQNHEDDCDKDQNFQNTARQRDDRALRHAAARSKPGADTVRSFADNPGHQPVEGECKKNPDDAAIVLPVDNRRADLEHQNIVNQGGEEERTWTDMKQRFPQNHIRIELLSVIADRQARDK